MLSEREFQRGASGALLMGAAWLASGIVAFVVPGGEGPGNPGELRFYLIEGLHAVGEAGLLAALVVIHHHQAATTGRLGRVGFKIAFVGTAVTLLSTVLWLAFAAAGGEGNLLTGLVFAAGMLGWLVGFPMLGFATVRAAISPRWMGWLLIAFIPLLWGLFFAIPAYGVGGVAVGILWTLVAYGLWSLRVTRAPTEAPAY